MSKEGTLIKPRYQQIYFDDVDIHNFNEAHSNLVELDSKLNEIQKDILALALATPSNITPKGESPYDYVKEKVEEMFDDLFEIAREYYTTDIITNILNEWSWGCNDDKELYENTEDESLINKRAFPKDEHIEIKRDLMKFSFAPQEDNVSETIVRGIQNIKLNESLSDNILYNFIILIHDKPYVDYDGQFLFASREKALNVLKKKIDFHPIDYISKEFVEIHPNYFVSLIERMKEQTLMYDAGRLNNFENDLNIVKEGKMYTHLDKLDFLHHTFEDFVINDIFKMLDIHLITFHELIQDHLEHRIEMEPKRAGN